MQQNVVKESVGKAKFIPALPSPSLQSLFLYSALDGGEMSAALLSHSKPPGKEFLVPIEWKA
jgi:hypothetical protein